MNAKQDLTAFQQSFVVHIPEIHTYIHSPVTRDWISSDKLGLQFPLYSHAPIVSQGLLKKLPTTVIIQIPWHIANSHIYQSEGLFWEVKHIASSLLWFWSANGLRTEIQVTVIRLCLPKLPLNIVLVPHDDRHCLLKSWQCVFFPRTEENMVILAFQKEKINNDFLQCAGWFVRSAQQMNPHGIMTETKMVCVSAQQQQSVVLSVIFPNFHRSRYLKIAATT